MSAADQGKFVFTVRTAQGSRLEMKGPISAERYGEVCGLLNGDKSVKELAALIHYPECWDTAAYPTFADALHKIGCSMHPPGGKG